jgi:hypothetical protein
MVFFPTKQQFSPPPPPFIITIITLVVTIHPFHPAIPSQHRISTKQNITYPHRIHPLEQPTHPLVHRR